MNRAAEFSALAQRAERPSYRRLWTSQAEEYALATGGPVFRLPSESAWAQLLDALGVAYEYDARFWLPARAAWLEVKEAAPTVGEIAAARGLVGGASATPGTQAGVRVYMVTGWPARKRFGVWVVAEAGEFVTVRADFRDLALANLLGVSFGRLYEGMEGVQVR